jgi:uncharacterized protein (DUF433 family)
MKNLITISPEICSGIPVFAGTRVPLDNFFDYIKSGKNIDEFISDFPSVEKKQIELFLKYIKNFISNGVMKYGESTD